MKPEVSVIIPTYNSEAYITKALESVFAQTYHNFEVILVDDASIDSTVRIARNFKDCRLKILENEQNKGVSYGRNLAIKRATGKWIALLDSDDWYAPRRLERLVAMGEANKADLMTDNLYLINEGQKEHWSTLSIECLYLKLSPFALIDAVKFATSDRLSPITAKRSWSLGYTKPLIRRRFLLDNQIQYDENLQVGEDFTLYLECLRQGAQFYFSEQPYYYYRTREASLSARKPIDYLAESCAITQNFINSEVDSSGQSRLLKTLLENLVIFQKRLAFYHLLENIRAGRLWSAIARIIDCPSLISDLYQKSFAVLCKKVKGLLSDQAVKTSDQPSSYSDLIKPLQLLK